MNVQLASTYNPAKNYKVASWFATPKFDGVRAVFIPKKGLFTRNNKPLSGFESMASALENICSSRGLSFIDGELIAHSGSFQTSQSIILAQDHAQKSNTEFHVFAVGGNFNNTQEMLDAIPHQPEAGIFRVNSIVIPNTPQAVEEACRKFTDIGYEGVVLRHPDIPYSEGRGNNLVKFKFFKEADLRIIGVQAGAGRLAGTLGSILVEGQAEGRKVKANVGTGLTDDDRKILGSDPNLTGKVLTVKYQAITDKPDNEGFYSLRFPVFIGIKEDRDFPEETAHIPAKPQFTQPSGLIYHNNGIVEGQFQVAFVKKHSRPSYLPVKSTMAAWKSKLWQCRNIQEGIELISELKLTIPDVREFAKYLGVNLRGCGYLKTEIVHWVVNASLGAYLRALQAKQEVQHERLFGNQKGNRYSFSTGSKFTACEWMGVDGYQSQRETSALHSWAGLGGLPRVLQDYEQCPVSDRKEVKVMASNKSPKATLSDVEQIAIWGGVNSSIQQLKRSLSNIEFWKLDKTSQEYFGDVYKGINNALGASYKAIRELEKGTQSDA